MSGTPSRWRLEKASPPERGDTCGTWPLQLAPQLSHVRAAVQEIARGRYAHPSLDTPEPSLLGVLERLALVVSELGGNALRHAHAPVLVSLSRLRGGWLLSVSDGDPLARPAIDAYDDLSHRHGLQVVSIVSTAVGWYADEESKHVWAMVPDQAPVGLSELVNA